MIPLRIRAEGIQGDESFVVRLKGPGLSEGMVSGPWDAIFASREKSNSYYDCYRGRLCLSGVPAADMVDDVLLVDPTHNVAHRLIRARSPHNTFLVTERCDQLCAMCSQPPKDHHTDFFSAFQQATLLAPLGMTIGISGGEPTLYKKELFELLQRSLTARPDLRFHVLTNAQHFDESDCQALKALPAHKVLWGIPVYASKPGLHDELVGKHGAFAVLMESLALLARCGAAIELRTVLMSSNAAELEPLAVFLASKLPFVTVWAIMQLENIGYGRMNWDRLFYDSGKFFTPVATAIDAARGRGFTVALYNFPLCTVPQPYRPFAIASISDWKRRFLAPCENCRLQESCGGFFEWYNESKGFSGVRAV